MNKVQYVITDNTEEQLIAHYDGERFGLIQKIKGKPRTKVIVQNEREAVEYASFVLINRGRK